jgi:hypothetical protein
MYCHPFRIVLNHEQSKIYISMYKLKVPLLFLGLAAVTTVSNIWMIARSDADLFVHATTTTTKFPPVNGDDTRLTMHKNFEKGDSPSLQFWTDNHRSYLKKTFTHTYPHKKTGSKLHHLTLSKDGDNDNGDDHDAPFVIRAVYYVNTKLNRNYNTWIENQLSILPPVDELYIVADAVSCAEEQQLHDAFALVEKNRTGLVHLECHDGTEESFEYNGIQKLWELGQEHFGKRDIAIYFHSKGVTRAQTWEQYIRKGGIRGAEAKLTANVFSQMDQVLEAFHLFPFVNVAGWDCSKGGFVWYNFMYVRGSYLRKVEQPLRTERRHYFEDWLRRAGLEAQRDAPNTTERPKWLYPTLPVGHCYSLAANYDANSANIGYYFDHLTRQRMVVQETRD